MFLSRYGEGSKFCYAIVEKHAWNMCYWFIHDNEAWFRILEQFKEPKIVEQWQFCYENIFEKYFEKDHTEQALLIKVFANNISECLVATGKSGSV